MKQLTAKHHDRGNCRLYVKDDDGKPYVILDQGHTFEKMGFPRFELMTHSQDGEPCSPIDKRISWELIAGTDSPFETGLAFTGTDQQNNS